ncbi:histidine phosphatase family protein [Mycobacterium barrassiae]|nr:histidine phosphatase family protein [Mycobacterium barrassiae]MCV7298333.1 histidine phosphatase family protein [Mycobacterium barrassiae]
MTLRRVLSRAAIAGILVVFTPLIGAGSAHANDHMITLTFIRSAESLSNAANLVDTSVPGPALSPLGFGHAVAAANELRANGYDGVYASTALRAQQSAEPLAQALGLPVTVLPGLRQIEAGKYEGLPVPETHVTETAAWLDGDLSTGIPGSITGDEFLARFNEAVQTIYDSGQNNPIAFGHSTSTMLWVLMNVSNPDDSLLTTHPLPNLGRIVVTGSPQDGWRLTYWDGAPIPE